MKRLTIFIYLLLSVGNLFADNGTKIYLLTVGPGDDVFLRWGHFAVIVDYQDKKDVLYDYGNFSLNEEGFVTDFIQGVMTYFKYKKSSDLELKKLESDNRTLIIQELNLNQEQVKECIAKLQNEVLYENMFYQYDQFYNNCVSQLADFLDELTEGAFYKDSSASSGRSFREYSRDYVSSNFIYNTLIMFLLGGKVDFDISDKEALFLPYNTMLWADNVMISDDKGGLKPLIKSKKTIYESVDRDPVIHNSKPAILKNMIIGIIIALITLLLRFHRPTSAGFLTIFGLIGGLTGSLLFFMSLFTGHYYIHNNWNLLMVNPLTFTLLVAGIMEMKLKGYTKGERLSYIYFDITLILVGVLLLLKIIGIINQGNGETIALLLPSIIANSSVMLLTGYQTGRGSKLKPKPGTSGDAFSRDSFEERITTE